VGKRRGKITSSLIGGQNMNERMFPFITKTWNPLGGECLHKCRYCWMNELKQKFPGLKAKYSGEPRIYDKELAKAKKFTEDDFVFVCDCTDLFGHWVPTIFIRKVMFEILNSPAKFLLLTKNPQRYGQYIMETCDQIPKNCILGCTVESDVDHILSGQPEKHRLAEMQNYSNIGYPVMLSIEPIMGFTRKFIDRIYQVKPKFVAVGYDNYENGLVEPSLAETCALIAWLAAAKIKVYRKTLREPLTISGKQSKDGKQ
jgi:DNA repair photolyase